MRLYFTAIGLYLAILPALAFGPQEALQYESPELAPAKTKLAMTKALQRARGYNTAGIASANRTKDKDVYSMSLRFSNDPLSNAEAKRSVAQAQDDLAQLQRNGVCDALLAHAALWDAQAMQTAAQSRLTAATLAKTEAERKHELGAISDLDVELARIDLADAELSAQRAAKMLVTAKQDAMRFKFTGEAEAAVLHFTLPDAGVEGLQEYRNLKWSSDIAEARRKAARREIRPGLGLDLNYIGSDFQLSSSVSTRYPSADLTFGYPSLYNDPSVLLWGKGWQTTLKLEIPLDPAARANARAAAAEAKLAKVILDEKKESLVVTLAQARTEAESALAGVDLAQQRVALSERKLEVIQAKAKAGAVSEIALHQETAACAEAQAKLAEAWKGYIGAVATYLDMVNGTWEAV